MHEEQPLTAHTKRFEMHLKVFNIARYASIKYGHNKRASAFGGLNPQAHLPELHL